MNKKETYYADNATEAPWLSVIVPIYNGEKYLYKCLNSISAQLYESYEVLMIDDGSTDGTATICQSFSGFDSRFKYVKKENGGAFQSRIYGLELSTGEYVTFCDADDYYLDKNAFLLLHSEVENSHCDVLQFAHIKKYRHLHKKESSVKSPICLNHEGLMKKEYPKLLCSFWDDAHITTSTFDKVYRRCLLTSLPASEFVENVFWGDDLILNLYLLSNCKSFKCIPDALYCYRKLTGGTNGFSARAMKDLDTIKKYQLMFLEHYQG